MERFSLTTLHLEEQIEQDKQLPFSKKVALVHEIEKQQKRRLERLKVFHKYVKTDMKTWHFFMKHEIELIRSQKIRLNALINNI